jgi:hypothetical protein
MYSMQYNWISVLDDLISISIAFIIQFFDDKKNEKNFDVIDKLEITRMKMIPSIFPIEYVTSCIAKGLANNKEIQVQRS